MARRRVSIQVGVTPPTPPTEVRPRMVVVGVAPYDGSFFVDAMPHARVSDSRYTPHRLGVEHLRFLAGHQTRALPGLEAPSPSRIRDAVNLALGTGCPSVDVLIARVDGVRSTDLAHERVAPLLVQALGELPGLVICFPDATGLPDAPFEPDNITAVAKTYGPVITDHYQVGVLDAPVDTPREWSALLRALHPSDFALATWTGDEHALEAHGWRNASALLASRIARTPNPMTSVLGAPEVVPGGRSAVRSRRHELGAPRRVRTVPPVAELGVCELALESAGDRVRVSVTNETVLRQPLGVWDLPLTRTTKLIHHRLVMTANLFVFHAATEANALLLQSALHKAFEDLVKRGIVEGPSGPRPQIHCVPDANRAGPAINASVTAFLKPWLREVRLELAVAPGVAQVTQVA